jgi:hypothetical protein
MLTVDSHLPLDKYDHVALVVVGKRDREVFLLQPTSDHVQRNLSLVEERFALSKDLDRLFGWILNLEHLILENPDGLLW